MKKKNGFQIVNKEEDPTEEIVEDIIEELQETVDPLEEIRQKTRIYKYRFWRTVILGASILIVLVMSVYYVLKYQVYDNINVAAVYENKDIDTSSYVEYAGGILKYSRDGVVYLNAKGKELWNQPCQMQNPVIERCRDTIAVGDHSGTSILIFQKDGLKGEIQTTRPIQKLTVSEQGIVGAVLKNELTPQIICYDAKGNILVEQNASLVNTGYPLDLAISHDGNTLLVSYIYTKGNTAATKAVYYNFGKAGENKKDHQVAEESYDNTIVPAAVFLDSRTSVLIGNDMLVFNKGLDRPVEVKKVRIKKEIKSVAYDDSGVTLMLKNSGGTDYELRTYDKSGKQVLSVNFDGEYGNMRMAGNQLILFDGNKCSIFSRSGVHKFEGKTETKIMEMFPITGFNKYMVISAAGLQEVQLVK